MKFAVALFACALALPVSSALAQQFTWTTIAGQPPRPGSTNGPAADVRFFNPNSLVSDAAGNLYVTDTFNHTVRKIAPDGSATTLAGEAGSSGTTNGTGSAARFSSPNGIVIDLSGNLFVADRGNHAIRRITPAGAVTTFAGLAGTSGTADGSAAEARFTSPSGLGFDRDGNLWIADTLNHSIRQITPGGTVSTFAGSSGVSGSADGTGAAARFLSPTALVVDASGNLLISDSGNATLRRITRDGAVTTLAGTAGVRGTASGTGAAARFNFPAGLALDSTGILYVADSANDVIRRVTAEGVVSTFAGSGDVRGSTNGTGNSARFYTPLGITFSSDGNLYVADTLNHTVRKVTLAQVVTNHSGPGGGFGNVNGTGTAARFNYPQGLTLDDQDNAYIADWRNGLVRKVTPASVVTSQQNFAGAYGIAWGGGVLAVSERTTHVIRLYALSSSFFIDAGTAGQAGSTDGPSVSALFNQPYGIAIDFGGRLLVADTANHTIRILSTIGTTLTVTTLAGSPGVSGATNAIGTAARFSAPRGVAGDLGGNIYVADTGAHTIRKIAIGTGAVTTLAGTAFSSGTAGGVGAAARFNAPEGIAADAAGTLVVADRANHAIRRISATGVVTTIGGVPGFSGYAEGTGTAARFSEPSGIAIDSTGAVYVVSAANNILMRGVLDATPTISLHPQSTVVATGTSAALSVGAAGGGLSYQWKYDGTPIAGATSSTYTLASAQPANSGRYTVDVSNSAGLVSSSAAQLDVQATVEPSRIVNLAIRSQAGTGAQTLIVGVGVGGAGTVGSKSILVRGIGPTLGAFGVAGVLTDPRLELYSGSTKINENDNWSGDAQITTIGGQVGAFALNNPTSRDAALYLPALATGSYSVQLTGGTGGGGPATGVALAEIYDATPSTASGATTPRLTNVSARTQVGTGGDILIAGFVIAGQTSKTVLIRAIGPTLASFNVPGSLADPKLELFASTGKINENDNWGGVSQLSTTFFAVGAFPLVATSRDAVLQVTLAPGSYTAQVSGVNGTTGVALVEVYEVP